MRVQAWAGVARCAPTVMEDLFSGGTLVEPCFFFGEEVAIGPFTV